MNPFERARIKTTFNALTFAFAFTPLIYYFIALKIPVNIRESVSFEMLKNIWIGIAVICVIAGLTIMNMNPLKFGKVTKDSSHPILPVQNQMIIAMAIHESIAIYGLVFYFFSGAKELLNVFVPISIVLVIVDRTRTKIELIPPKDS